MAHIREQISKGFYDKRYPLKVGGYFEAPAAITSFAGTVSAAAKVVTFSAAADHALCKVGSTIVAGGHTRVIVALSASPNVTVDANTVWGGATAITSLTDPISQHKDSAGNVDMYVNALGGIGLVGGTEIQKGITFGGGSGVFSPAAGTLGFNANNSETFRIIAYKIFAPSPGRFSITTSGSGGATVATYGFYGDENTGIGRAAVDQLSLIAGGVEGIRLSETTTKMAEKFGCAALGGVGRVASYATKVITANATVTIQVNIPSGAKILGVQMRVDVALAAGETWIAAYSGGATQNIATDEAVAVNTKVNKFFDENAATPIVGSETDIAITKTGGGAFTAQGTIRAVVYYEEFTNLADI